MGLFGGSKNISINIPEIKLPTAEELISAATGQVQSLSPLAVGAREGALGDLAQGTSYYESFQPTSLENALANQYFENVLPDAQKRILSQLSLSGVANSPIAARLIGKQAGDLGVQVGSYLSDLGNQRAQYSLSQRLGIDPFANITPLANIGLQSATQQAQLQRERDLQLAQVELANQMKNQQSSGLGRLIGMGVGALAAPFTGGLSLLPAIGIGGGIGALASGDFQLGDALGLFGGISSLGSLGSGAAAGIGGAGGIASKGISNLLNVNPGQGLLGAIA